MLNATNARHLLLAGLSTLSAFSVACTADVTNVYQTAAGANQAQGVSGDKGVPAGVWLDSVNAVSFYPSAAGLVVRSDDTSRFVGTPGGFNGGGVGNKAYVGLTEFNEFPVSSLRVIEIEARQDRGTPLAFMNLQVDCDGNGIWESSKDAIVVIDSDANTDVSLSFDFTSTFKRISFAADKPLFKAVTPLGTEKCGLPPHLGTERRALTSVPATARLFNGKTGDGGMPNDTFMPSIMFVMNDSNQRAAKQVTIRELKVNDKSFRFSN
jgi:hypothetical protein